MSNLLIKILDFSLSYKISLEYEGLNRRHIDLRNNRLLLFCYRYRKG